MIIAKVQHVTKIQTITTYVNVMDVNVTVKCKVIEGQVFKDRKLKKAKNVANWKKKKTVEKVNGGNNSTYSKNTNLDKRAIHIH
jgi:hypothetical protein